MKRIGITGGAGFVGFNLAKYLTLRGYYEVRVLDSLIRKGSQINADALRQLGVQTVIGDVRDTEMVATAFKGCECILHCASQPTATAGFDDPVADYDHNVTGTLNVLEYARLTGAGVIYWSTNKVYSGHLLNALPTALDGSQYGWTEPPYSEYGLPETFPLDGGQKTLYGVTKAMGDLLCQEYASAFKVPVWINRCSCLAGPHQWGMAEQGWIAWFAIAHALGKPIELYGWGGCQTRDVLHISDLCDLIEQQIGRMGEADGSAFNVGGGPYNSVSPMEVLMQLGRLTGITVRHVVKGTPRRNDQRVYVSDIRKVKEKFNWSPVIHVSETVARVDLWVRENKNVIASVQG